MEKLDYRKLFEESVQNRTTFIELCPNLKKGEWIYVKYYCTDISGGKVHDSSEIYLAKFICLWGDIEEKDSKPRNAKKPKNYKKWPVVENKPLAIEELVYGGKKFPTISGEPFSFDNRSYYLDSDLGIAIYPYGLFIPGKLDIIWQLQVHDRFFVCAETLEGIL